MFCFLNLDLNVAAVCHISQRNSFETKLALSERGQLIALQIHCCVLFPELGCEKAQSFAGNEPKQPLFWTG